MSVKTPKIQVTTNYRLFYISQENRATDLRRHKRLLKSMEKYGFLQCFPIICSRDAAGNLAVKDGQHRLVIAERLKLPVYWIVDDSDFDVAEINCTPKGWVAHDFCEKWARHGKSDYQELIDFTSRYKLPITTAAALLADMSSYTAGLQDEFISGRFKIKDKDFAHLVADFYVKVCGLNREVRGNRFLHTCMTVFYVEAFKPERFLRNAKRCREKLVGYSTNEAFLTMMEEVYNFGHHQLVPLKVLGQMAMRSRSPIHRAERQADSA